MRKRKYLVFKLCILCTICLFIISTVFSSCENGGKPIIVNQTAQELAIYCQHFQKDGSLEKRVGPDGIIPSHTTIKIDTIAFYDRDIRITALDPSGNIIFSHDYSYDDIVYMEWVIVIPSLS